MKDFLGECVAGLALIGLGITAVAVVVFSFIVMFTPVLFLLAATLYLIHLIGWL